MPGDGLVAALITPVLTLISGVLVPLGGLHLHYETVATFRAPSDRDPIGKLVLFSAVALPGWHAALRLRMTTHDLGLGGGVAVQALRRAATARELCGILGDEAIRRRGLPALG